MQAFEPIFTFETAHSQTLLGHFIKSDAVNAALTDVVLTLRDHDQLLLQILDQKSPRTAIIMHGLGSNSQADYIRRTANICLARGWNIVLVNQRGAHPKAQARLTYHSGRGKDLEDVLLWCRNNLPNTQLTAIGFSMSGSILLNLLCRRYGQHQPDFAISVNAPLKLGDAAKKLSQGFNRMYDLRFYFLLKNLILLRSENTVALPLIGTTQLIDELYTSKLNGFKDADDYYTQCSTFEYVNQITTPTFVLSAKDDPFISGTDYETANWSPATKLTLTSTGGHLGYISKKSIKGFARRWLDHYLDETLNQIEAMASPTNRPDFKAPSIDGDDR